MIGWFSRLFASRRLQERRHYPRTRTSNLVKFFDPRVSTEVQIYNMADLSAGGLQFRSPERFRANQSLNLLINLAEKKKQVAVLGRVVWSAAYQADPSAYRIGVHFSAIGEDDRMNIRDYVRWAKGRLRFSFVAPLAGILFCLTALLLHFKIFS